MIGKWGVWISLTLTGVIAACGSGGQGADSSVEVAPPTGGTPGSTAAGGSDVVSTSGAPPASATTPRSEFERSVVEAQPVDAVLEWKQPELALSDPVLAGDTVLMYTYADGVQLTALDLASGDQRWSVPASTSALIFTELEPIVIDQHVFAFADARTGDSKQAVVVALDVSTGNGLWTSDPGAFTDLPEVCDDGAALCVFEDAQTRALSLATGDQTALWATNANHLGGDLYAGIEADQWVIGQYGPNGPGWSFIWNEVAGVEPEPLVSPVAWESGVDNIALMMMMTREGAFGDTSFASMLAVDESDGSILWSEQNATTYCAGAGYPVDEFKTVRCRIDGAIIPGDGETNEYDIPDYAPYGWPERTDTVEVFDPVTGETINSVVARPTPAWDGQGEIPRDKRYGRLASALVVETADQLVALDPAGGEVVTLPSGAIAWCFAEPVDDPETFVNANSGYRPCDPASDWSEPTGQLPPMSPEIGVAAGDLAAFVRDGHLEVYRVS